MRTFGRTSILGSVIRLGVPPSQSAGALRLSSLLLSDHLLGLFHPAVSQLFLIVFFFFSAVLALMSRNPSFKKRNIPVDLRVL